MALSEYTYDADGETWPFYVLAVLTFVLLPLTASWVYLVVKPDVLLANALVTGAITTEVKTPQADNIRKFRTRQRASRVLNKTLVAIVVGWLLVAYIALFLTKEALLAAVKFDPYTLLDVAVTALEKEIKSKYRKLSVTKHPDKLRGKGLLDAEYEAAEAMWVQIGLAYKSLTDPATRENFMKYGHPDGPQEILHGIALPTWLVEGKYLFGLVLAYFLLVGGLLPWVVGLWWNNVKLHTKKGLHVDTAAHFTRRLVDRNPTKVVTPDTILEWVLWSHEVKHAFLARYTPPQLIELVELHLKRQDAGAREQDKLKLVAMLPPLIGGLVDIAVVFRQIDVVLPATDLQKAIVAAVDPTGKHQELAQLPFTDAAVVEKLPVKRLGKLLTLSADEQKKVLGISDLAHLKAAIDVAQKIPGLRVVDAKFIVPGEPHCTPLLTAYLLIKFLVKGWRLKLCPEIDEERFAEDETMEYMRNPLLTNDAQPALPVAYTPYFPSLLFNNWTGYLIDQKDNRLVENSTGFKLTNADLLNLLLTQEEWIDGSKVVVLLIKVQLPAPTPALVGTYPYRVLLKNNAYFGCDVDIPVFMDVEAAPQIKVDVSKYINKEQDDSDDSDSESDISDAEEDPVAAALKALKNLADDKKSSKVQEVDDDDDDDESIFTDINTDTEDEADDEVEEIKSEKK